MSFALSEKYIYFHTDYSLLYRFVYSAHVTKKLNPNISLAQSRLILEILVESMVGQKGNLISRIIELEEFWGVERDIIEAMHIVRFLGNIGVHTRLTFREEAERSLKALFKVMQWYGSSDHRLIADENLLADVQFCVAVCYEVGTGTEPDTDKQIEWLEKSCENGSPFALRDLGLIYFYGKIRAQDFKKAAALFKEAVNKGSVDAEYILGFMYMNSYGLNRDAKAAYDLFVSAASKGNLLAEYALAEHFNPIETPSSGIPYNPKDNFARYNHIVEQGNDDDDYFVFIPKVWIKLGDCHQYGLGTEKNFAKSLECYLKAAKRGDRDACYKVGQCYEKGVGTAKDLSQAKHYYSLAALSGHSGATNKLNQLDYEEYKKILRRREEF